jgi:hypothetical protein
MEIINKGWAIKSEVDGSDMLRIKVSHESDGNISELAIPTEPDNNQWFRAFTCETANKSTSDAPEHSNTENQISIAISNCRDHIVRHGTDPDQAFRFLRKDIERISNGEILFELS